MSSTRVEINLTEHQMKKLRALCNDAWMLKISWWTLIF